MLEDVNNEELDIDVVVDEHFNRDNYLTWLAVNLIMGNIDTNSQNFYLYSPKNSPTWYFLPWDYDGAWGFYNQFGKTYTNRPPWQKGVSDYGGVVLTRRFLEKEKNVEQLISKVEELNKIITTENTSMILDGYYQAIQGFLSQNPDLSGLPKGNGTIKEELERIIAAPEKNIIDFYDSIKTPMPVFTCDPYETEDNKIGFAWGKSFCPNGDEITYELTISSDPDFQKVILDLKNITATNYSIDELDEGTYFFKLSINSSNGASQVTFDKYTDEKGKVYFGIRKVIID